MKETIYYFYYFRFTFCLFNLFNSFCKDWSTSLRWFVSWKELNISFLYFLLMSLFFPMLGILSNSMFPWKKNRLLFQSYQTLNHSWQQFFQWIDTWTVYRDSPPVEMWTTMCAVSVLTLQGHTTIKCDICNWVKIISCHRGDQYSFIYSQYVFPIDLQK